MKSLPNLKFAFFSKLHNPMLISAHLSEVIYMKLDEDLLLQFCRWPQRPLCHSHTVPEGSDPDCSQAPPDSPSLLHLLLSAEAPAPRSPSAPGYPPTKKQKESCFSSKTNVNRCYHPRPSPTSICGPVLMTANAFNMSQECRRHGYYVKDCSPHGFL